MNWIEAITTMQWMDGRQWLVAHHAQLKELVVESGKCLIAAVYLGVVPPQEACHTIQQLARGEAIASLKERLGAHWSSIQDVLAQWESLESLPLTGGHYFLYHEPLGKGGFAAIFRALDTRVGREVAIKVLHRRDAISQARFKKEISALCTLDHSHIVRILDTFSEKSRDFLVMEYIAGGNLEQMFQRRELNSEYVLKIVLQLLSALAYIHERGILHRDLKPANVLLASEELAKITDFGLTQEIVPAEERLTREDQTVGTLGYMAPEMLRGREYASVVSDLYSIGLIAFRGLFGFHPLLDGRPTPEDIRQATVFEDIKLPANSAVDKQLGRIVIHSLAYDPAKRFPSAEKFIAEIEAYRGIQNCRNSSTYRPKPDSKRIARF